MRKLTTLTLTGPNTSASLPAGRFNVLEGFNATAIRLPFRFRVVAAGASRKLDDFEKQELLRSFSVALQWGAEGQHKPYNGVKLDRLQILTRSLGGSEWEGYSDAFTGLDQQFGGDEFREGQDVKLYARVPLSMFWQDSTHGTSVGAGAFGVGPTQAASIVLTVEQGEVKLPKGWRLEGNVYVDVIPDEFPSAFDRVSQVPRWHQFPETSDAAELPVGLPWLVVEQTSRHVSTQMEEVSFSIEGAKLYDRVTLQEAISLYNDAPNFPAEANVLDRETIVHAYPPGVRLAGLLTGTARFEQAEHLLSPMRLGVYYSAVPTEKALRHDVKAWAQKKKRKVNCVSIATALGLEVPEHLVPFLGYALFTEKDPQFDKFPGLLCGAEERDEPTIYFPLSALTATALRVRARETAGELLAAEEELKQLVLPIPGAVLSAKGFREITSPTLEVARNQVRNAIGQLR